MVLLLERDGYFISYAIGTDLTEWDNAQVKLAVAETNALDWFRSAEFLPTHPKTQKINPMSASHYPKRTYIGQFEGELQTTHFLQTGILTYAVMGACSTAGGADPYTHTITKGTTTTPINIAFHLEKEGTTAAPRWDAMGFIPRSIDIVVSEQQTIASQTYIGDFAYTKDGADDLEEPTKITNANLPPYTWFHHKDASGASKFTYNSATSNINLDLTEIRMHIGWADKLWGAYDSTGFRSDGHTTPPFEAWVDIGARRTDAAGTDIQDIVKLKPASYAGDLDFIMDFYVGASDYLKYTFDKMYIPRDSFKEVFPTEDIWYEGVQFRLELLNETSSLAVEEKNLLDKTFYEND